VTDRLTDPDGAMRAYYERRAAEYDTWWLGTGLFADRDRPGWDDEREALLDVLRALPPRRTLDVACGTGFLSRVLPGELTLLDQSAAMIAIAGGRTPRATALVGEAIPLPFPDGAFERVFTGHFYGHLLPDEREAFLAEARRVAPELVVVDSAGEPREAWDERRLEDGTRHRVYKRWFTGASLAAEIGGEALLDGDWFVAVQVTAL
jgi:demethylmenaquinone methyltransferase/2-methoxy-6-polyprenyl-1,4-benzoquinol methylase